MERPFYALPALRYPACRCALLDCVRALPFPYVEVHMTNIEKHEIRSVLTPVTVGSVAGFGVQSCVLGLEARLGLLRK
jgi:3-dehydroquinate dehydratase-2